MELKVIAHIYNDFTDKFGIPRQSGILSEMVSVIVFEKEYRIKEALRGIEDFSHLWLLWHFSENSKTEWSPCVRPPRLGGNKRMGVFATRSPFRPNQIGLSSVKLEGIEDTPQGTVLYVTGADMLSGTPIFDIKPYIKYTDSHPDAVSGFADGVMDYSLEVLFPEELLKILPEKIQKTVITMLENDPRPSYKAEGERIYGMCFGDYEIKFTVNNKILTVTDVALLRE